MTRVAMLAEQHQHHPRWSNVWNTVEIWLNTHDAGNVITEKDHALAKAIGVPANRINEIIRGRRGVTADTDLRLARFFGLSEGYWLRLQNSYDMMAARREDGNAIRRIRPYGGEKPAAYV